MKKIIIIFLLGIYSLSTLGLSLKSFYCCGKLKSVTVSIAQHQQQKCSKHDAMNDCCKTKYQFFKVKDNHVAGDIVTAPAFQFSCSHLFTSPFRVINYPSEKNGVANLINGPPRFHSVASYILNRVFRV